MFSERSAECEDINKSEEDLMLSTERLNDDEMKRFLQSDWLRYCPLQTEFSSEKYISRDRD